MTTFVFPGQGSQVKGMGASLFEEFSGLTQKADHILGYSISKLCIEDTNNELGKTNFTQPALYTVSAMSYLKKLAEIGKPPESVAGHSLGEYNALFAAGVFDFETGLKLVQKRGALMSAATHGGMAAVVGLKSDDVRTILQQNTPGNIVIANYNSFTQIVISGDKEAILAAEPIFMNAGAMLYLPLNVSGAFHSPLMQNAQNEFAEFIKGFQFRAPQIKIIANIDAKPYETDKIAANLVQQITHPVLWTQTIEYLLKQGATEFVEVGPGKVLTGLITRIQRQQ